MASRDNFLKRIVNDLAKRANGQCSNPRCDQTTHGPSKGVSGYVHIGVAAHISAASKGGPRFDPNMPPSERRSIENAIYLCQNCAKLIDANGGKDYPVEKLRQWKEDHEAMIRDNMENPAKGLKERRFLLQPGINRLEAEQRWDQLVWIFSEESANRLADQIANPRRAIIQKDCPDVRSYVEKKFKLLGADLQERYAEEIGQIYKRAKKALDLFISSKNREQFLSDWVKLGENLRSLGYFQ